MASTGAGRGIYRWSCPNCGLSNSEERLSRGLPCERCLRRPPKETSIEAIRNALKREGTLSEGYEALYTLEVESTRLIEFFEDIIGSRPWGAQRTWARRLVRGDSFSIIAPTGVGKTTFGLVAALYYACKGEKSYIVVPTTTLVVQALEKLESMTERAPCSPRIVAVYAKMPRKARIEAEEDIASGSFDILISTAAYMRKNADVISRHRFRLVFVDDVDAVLRSAKSVDAVLRVVGFSQDDIELGLQALSVQRRLASIAARYRALAEAGRRDRLEDVRKQYRELEKEWVRLSETLMRARGKAASLIVSSATGRPRGRRVRLFRVLLGFEAGGRGDIGLRNVIDSYTDKTDDPLGEAARIAAELGDGTLVFVPIDAGVEAAERLASTLRDMGLRAEAYHAKKPISIVEAFRRGELEVLVGVANYYGTLVRGLDLPERVKYAVFAGVPRHKFAADVGEPHPTRMLRLLGLLAESKIEEIAETARRHMAVLRRLVRNLSPAALQMIAEKVSKGEVSRGDPTWSVMEAYIFLRNALADREVWEELKGREDVAVVEEEGRLYLLIPDAATYLQASGRTSRLYAGGITKGLSIVVVDDERLLRGLQRRTRWMADVQWVHIGDLDLESLKKEIEEDRRNVKNVLGGKVRNVELVRTALLIVESPNKARTIASFFGQPSVRVLEGGTRVYEVATGGFILSIAASGGHVYDLVDSINDGDLPPGIPRDGIDLFGVYVNGGDFLPVYTSLKRCLDCGYQFVEETNRCPRCGSTRIRDSRRVVDDLARIAWEVDIVLIGTDPDTEGEKIGWDTSLLLRPYSRAIARLEFHEVTRQAILRALESLRDFDQRLVDAQIVRRVEDRWIGYTLSPLLWCDFWPNHYCASLLGIRSTHTTIHVSKGKWVEREAQRCLEAKYNYALSAGRVQTPTLGWVVERTEEARIRVNLYVLEFDGSRISFREDEVKGAAALSGLVKPRKPAEVEVRVVEVERRTDLVPPPPPYTTDSLLADASRLLGFGAPETMALAQNLFEWGLITYHRTDSTRVSDRGMEVAREWIYSTYPSLARALYKPRRWGEGGAHEAIRPTRPIDAATLERLIEEGVLEIPGILSRRHLRLYDLIFRRFMASQMREALVHRALYRVEIPLHEFSIEVERPVGIGSKASQEPEPDDAEAGFLHVWHPYYRVQRPLPIGYHSGLLYVRKIRKVPPYTQGELIEEMKRRGIGRPSTYAKIVDTLLRRAYAARVASTMIVATPRGKAVYEYLTKTLANADEGRYGRLAVALRGVPQLVSEERTRTLEEYMDSIERGRADRTDVLRELHNEIWPIASAILGIARGNGFLRSLRECVEGRRKALGGRGGDE